MFGYKCGVGVSMVITSATVSKLVSFSISVWIFLVGFGVT